MEFLNIFLANWQEDGMKANGEMIKDMEWVYCMTNLEKNNLKESLIKIQ